MHTSLAALKTEGAKGQEARQCYTLDQPKATRKPVISDPFGFVIVFHL